MDINFFLYLGFSVVLFIITFTDLLYKTVDDRVIIAGIGYVLICQFHLGQIIFSLTGAIVGFIISFCIFWFGNNYFTISVKTPLENEICPGKFGAGLIFPFVPALTISVIVHALLSDGLANFLLDVIFFIKSHSFVSLTVIIVAVISLFGILRSKTIYIDSTHFSETEKNVMAFGDGDVTASIFLGSVLGWQNFIAVFWLATVIFSIVGIIISLKQKGKFKWT